MCRVVSYECGITQSYCLSCHPATAPYLHSFNLRHDGAHGTPCHVVPAPRPVPCERCSKHAEYVANTTVSRPKRRGCHSTLQSSPTTERGDSPSGAHIARARLGLVTKRRPEVPHECTQGDSRWLWRAVERQRMTTRVWLYVRSRPSDQHSA